MAAISITLLLRNLYASDLDNHILVEEIEVINNNATIYEIKTLIFTMILSNVGKMGIPNVIRTGDLITVRDKKIKANQVPPPYFDGDYPQWL